MKLLVSAVVGISVVFATVSALADGPNPDTCTGYPEQRVFLESQGWWATTGHDGITDGNDQGNNLGHIHVGTCFPLFEPVSGTVGFDLKIRLHDNPGQLTHVQPFICANQQTTACYRAPDIVFSPSLTCATQCVFYQHVDIDTTRWAYDGMNAVRFRTEVLEPDGNVLRASNNWLMDIRNGNPMRTFIDGSAYLDAKGWYHGFYSSVKVYGGYTPNSSRPFTVLYKCGSTSEAVQDCLATVDPDFHAIPPSFGEVVQDNASSKRQTVTIDPAAYPVGSHNLVLRTCVHDTKSVPGKDAHRCGVLKLPFTTP